MAGRSGRKKRGGRQRRKPAAELTDDLVVEILSRVPYKSLCRFRCVSRRWSALISHPDHRRKLPQSLVGFFFHSHDDTRSPETARHFVNVSSRDRSPPFIHPSLSFLPNPDYDHLDMLSCCNGLLLCRCSQTGAPDTYIVVHPATEKWVDLPVSQRWSDKPDSIIRLGFDPAISSHFHVFAFAIDSEDDDAAVDGDGIVLGVDIYSSKTRLWSYKPCGSEIWMNRDSDSRSVFLDGMLYMVALEIVVVAVDVEGKTWRVIDMPNSYLFGTEFIDLSQGQMHLTIIDNVIDNVSGRKLSIWILDHASEEWTLKHEVSLMDLQMDLHYYMNPSFVMVCIHPERNLMFFFSGQCCTLLSYDMDTRDVCVIRDLGQTCDQLVPYVPLFSESLADGK